MSRALRDRLSLPGLFDVRNRVTECSICRTGWFDAGTFQGSFFKTPIRGLPSGWRGAVKTRPWTENLMRHQTELSDSQSSKPYFQIILLSVSKLTYLWIIFLSVVQNMGVNMHFFTSHHQKYASPLKEEPISFQRTNHWRMLYLSALSAGPLVKEGGCLYILKLILNTREKYAPSDSSQVDILINERWNGSLAMAPLLSKQPVWQSQRGSLLQASVQEDRCSDFRRSFWLRKKRQQLLQLRKNKK